MDPGNIIDGEATQLETVAGGLCSGQTHRLNRLRQGNLHSSATTLNAPHFAAPNRVPATGQLRGSPQFRGFTRTARAAHPTQRSASVPGAGRGGPISGSATLSRGGENGRGRGRGSVDPPIQAIHHGPQKPLPKPPRQPFPHHPTPNQPPPKTLVEDAGVFMKRASESLSASGMNTSRWANPSAVSQQASAPQDKKTSQPKDTPQVHDTPRHKEILDANITSQVQLTPRVPISPQTTAGPPKLISPKHVPKVRLPPAPATPAAEIDRLDVARQKAATTTVENASKPLQHRNPPVGKNPMSNVAPAWTLSFGTLSTHLDKGLASNQDSTELLNTQKSTVSNTGVKDVTRNTLSKPTLASPIVDVPLVNRLHDVVSEPGNPNVHIEPSVERPAQAVQSLIDFSDDETDLTKRAATQSLGSEAKTAQSFVAPRSTGGSICQGPSMSTASSKWSTHAGNLIPGQTPSSMLDMLELIPDFDDFPTMVPNGTRAEQQSPHLASKASSEALPSANRDFQFPLSKFSSFSTTLESVHIPAESPVVDLTTPSQPVARSILVDVVERSHAASQAILPGTASAHEPAATSMQPSPGSPSPAKFTSTVPTLPQISLQATTGSSVKTISSVFNKVFDAITPEMLRRVARSPETISGSE